MDPILKKQLQQTIYVSTLTSRNAAGTGTWGVPASRAAKVQKETRQIRLLSGEEVTTSHLIFVEDEIAADSRIWLPGDDSNDATKARRVYEVEPIIDVKGNTAHYEISV